MVPCLFVLNGTSKGQIIAEHDSFRVIACLVYLQLLSVPKIITQNKKTIVSRRDRSLEGQTTIAFKPIIFSGSPESPQTAWNVILWLHSSRLSRGSDIYRQVKLQFYSTKFDKIRQLLDRYITITFLKVICKIRLPCTHKLCNDCNVRNVWNAWKECKE